MSRTHKALVAGIGLVAMLDANAQEAEQPPGIEALEELDTTQKKVPVSPVQNRFFTKSKRFEIAPAVGLAPNNPLASRFSASLILGYHFNEVLSLQFMASYLPDLKEKDVKNLVPLLLDRARAASESEDDNEFWQPLDKTTLFTQIGVAWSPIYGKINILGETVVNFDFYGFLGIGFILQNEYRAYDLPCAADQSCGEGLTFRTDLVETEVLPAPTIGLGGNFFITQTVALKLDGRFGMVIDFDKPKYNVAGVDEEVAAQQDSARVVPVFNASIGVAFFFPKMKRRLSDF